MPELRQDPVNNQWVVIATERGKRPSDFKGEQPKRKGGFCPFCVGNEKETPPEVYALRDKGSSPDAPGWEIRVVPNKFAALSSEGEPEAGGDVLHFRINGVGSHEVIVEATDHDQFIPDYSSQHMEKIIATWWHRYQSQERNPKIKYTQIFKNHGATAGASLEHPHSQLIALPLIPGTIRAELEGASRFHQEHGQCVYCQMLKQEQEDGQRVIIENDTFIAFAPFASRFPFESWILPKQHQASFGQLGPVAIGDLADITQKVTSRLFTTLSNPPYNMVLHSSPHREQKYNDSYHWHLEFLPRVTIVAGFEWGTGCYINPTPPEEAAQFLRQDQQDQQVSHNLG